MKLIGPHTTMKQIHRDMYPWHFPSHNPRRDERKESSIYVICSSRERSYSEEELREETMILDISTLSLILKSLLEDFVLTAKKFLVIVVLSCFSTQKDLEEHIKKGCYPKNTGQFKLSKENEFFHSENCCPRNPFSLIADTETEMKRYIERLDPDSDWNEEHIPQAIEFHMVTIYPDILEMFHIPLHYKVQGNDCIEKAVKEYLKLFEKKIVVNG